MMVMDKMEHFKKISEIVSKQEYSTFLEDLNWDFFCFFVGKIK